MSNTVNYTVQGFCGLHYGSEYLRQSLLSIRDHIDSMYIAYSPIPTHGFGTTDPCPDNEKEMFDIAMEVMGTKLIWTTFPNGFGAEGAHRNERYKHAANFQLILTIDADEIFEPKEIRAALDFAYNGKERFYGITGYINFFRNFSHCCRDGFAPIRIENTMVSADNMTQNLGCPLTIYHFSLCQREETLRYKFKVFGHANEIKPNYLEEKYYAWTPEKINEVTHVHPTSDGIWQICEKFDKTTLPQILKDHPNYNKDLV